MVPGTDHEIMLARGCRRSTIDVASIVAQRAGLVVIEIAGCRQHREIHASIVLGFGFGGKIEGFVAYVVEPHLHERELLAAVVSHPPIVLSYSDGIVQLLEGTIGSVLFEHLSRPVALVCHEPRI